MANRLHEGWCLVASPNHEIVRLEKLEKYEEPDEYLTLSLQRTLTLVWPSCTTYSHCLERLGSMRAQGRLHLGTSRVSLLDARDTHLEDARQRMATSDAALMARKGTDSRAERYAALSSLTTESARKRTTSLLKEQTRNSVWDSMMRHAWYGDARRAYTIGYEELPNNWHSGREKWLRSVGGRAHLHLQNQTRSAID